MTMDGKGSKQVVQPRITGTPAPSAVSTSRSDVSAASATVTGHSTTATTTNSTRSSVAVTVAKSTASRSGAATSYSTTTFSTNSIHSSVAVSTSRSNLSRYDDSLYNPRSDVATAHPATAASRSDAAKLYSTISSTTISSVAVTVAGSPASRSDVTTSSSSRDARKHDVTTKGTADTAHYLVTPVIQGGARPKELPTSSVATRAITASHLKSSTKPKRSSKAKERACTDAPLYADTSAVDPELSIGRREVQRTERRRANLVLVQALSHGYRYPESVNKVSSGHDSQSRLTDAVSNTGAVTSYGEIQEPKARMVCFRRARSQSHSSRRHVFCEIHGIHCDLKMPNCRRKSVLKSTVQYASLGAETTTMKSNNQKGPLSKGYKRFGAVDMMAELKSYLLKKGMDKKVDWNLIFTEFASTGFIRLVLLGHQQNITLPLLDTDHIMLNELQLHEKQKCEKDLQIEVEPRVSSDCSTYNFHGMENRDENDHNKSSQSETQMFSQERCTEIKVQVFPDPSDGGNSVNSSHLGIQDDTMGDNTHGYYNSSRSSQKYQNKNLAEKCLSRPTTASSQPCSHVGKRDDVMVPNPASQKNPHGKEMSTSKVGLSTLVDAAAAENLNTNNTTRSNQSHYQGKSSKADNLKELADVVAAEIQKTYGAKSDNGQKKKGVQESKKKGSAKLWVINMVVPHRIEKGVLISYIKEILAIDLSGDSIEIDKTDTHKTKVRVTFQKRKDANYALEQFKRDQTIEHACLSHHSGSMVIMTTAEQKDYIEKEWESLNRKTAIPVSKHEDKIDFIHAEMKRYKPRKAIPLGEFERTQQQREALSYKLAELKSQKDVFTSFVTATYERLKMLKGDNISQTVGRIRVEFALELNRFASALPMYAKKTDIIRTVRENQVSIILGETGSGKSTQMVQYLHQAGLCNNGKIVCTQPRKVAAISLAQHVSKEMGDSVGRTVGYQVGMSSKCSSITKVIYVTDHVLLNHCLQDPNFNEYSCIIIDEAHERSIYTDLLLGMIKKALPKRHDLKVLVTSATIDPEVFVKYFNGCPVLRVSGRTFPVDVEYENETADAKPTDINENYLDAAVAKALEVYERTTDGDILVFLTSPLETDKASDMLDRKSRNKNMSILQLHGRLQPRQQQQVFEPAPKGTRKVVFATNSAETSITIPGIRHVVDTGLAKEMCYDPNRNINSLEVRYISKSSAEQRKGRAGRTQAGTCYRLYSESTFDGMQPSSVPEILRTHLGLSLLQLLVLGIEDVDSFDFVQSPPEAALKLAMDTLDELGAIKDGRITDLGRQMAKLSIEPRLAKLVLSGIEVGVGFAAIITAAVCSSGNIFFRGGGASERDAADKQKACLCHEGGDVLTLVDVYYKWLAIAEKQKNNWCVKNSINAKSMRLARETVDEIHKVLSKELKVKVKYGVTAENLHEKLPVLLLQSFKTNLAYFTGNRRSGYIIAHRPNEILHVHPSAVQILLNLHPKWVIFERILITSRQFMLNLTPVDENLVLEMYKKKEIVLDLDRILEMTVHPIVANVGSSTLQYLTGPKCIKLRELEASIKENHTDQVGEISTYVNVLAGQVSIHTSIAFSHTAFDSLQENLTRAKEKLAVRTVEHPIQGESSVRYVLGAGGTVRTLLMPWQFRSLIVCEVPHGAELQEVLDHFSKYGQVESHDVFRSNQTGKPTKLWGKITYTEESQAKEACQNIQEEDLEDTYIGYRIRPEKSRYQGSDDFQASVKIEWCRRQHKGFGFVTCNYPEDAVYITSRTSSLCIDGKFIKVSISRNIPNQVFLTGIPKTADERDVQDCLEEQFPDLIDKVMLPRENVPETSNSDLDMYRKRLTAQLSETLEDADYTIQLLKPSPKAFIFRGYLRFEDTSKAQDIVDKLDGDIYLDSRPVSMVLELQSAIVVPCDLWPFVHESLEEGMEDLKSSHDKNVNFTVMQPKMGGRRIRMTSSSSTAIAICKDELNGILQGTSIPITSTKSTQAIKSLTGQHVLEDIRKQTKSYIKLDRRSSSLRVLGTARSQVMAAQFLKAFLQNAEEHQTCEIRLTGSDRPVGLLKQFILTFGLNGEELVRRCELYSVAILLKQHVIRLHGSKGSVESAQSVIDDMSSNLPKVDQSTEEEECCPVCMCPVENLFRLEFCGDAYCRECLSNLVQNGIDTKTFPLTCAKADCKLLMSLEDIQRIVGRTQTLLEPLAQAAIECLVRENGDDWNYCITPDCPMVYRVCESGEKLCCPCCGTAICTKCNVAYHDGLTCAMYGSIKRDKDPALKNWQSENPGLRSFCPGCRRPIEKNEGCMHMTCAHCKIHFCWRCKKCFRSDRATYDHLSAECGGIF